MDAEMTLRFQDTSLDPYLRFFEPRLSPFTTAVASGTVARLGSSPTSIVCRSSTRVEQLDLKLFDYAARQRRPDRAGAEQPRAQIGRLRVVGEGTRLQLGGSRAAARRHRRRGSHRRGEPRHPSGVLPRPSQPRHGGAAGRGQGTARESAVFRQRAHRRRPHPPPVGAARARGDRRHHLVRRHGHPPRGRDGTRGRRAGRVRRTDRP